MSQDAISNTLENSSLDSLAGHIGLMMHDLPKWDRRMLELARFVAGWSKDPSTKVGAVIADGNKVVSLGFNGPPSGFLDDYWQDERSRKLGVSLHAEENAILHAHRPLNGLTAYVTHMPCSRCYVRFCQVGIRRVYYLADEDIEARWASAKETLMDILDKEWPQIPMLYRVYDGEETPS